MTPATPQSFYVQQGNGMVYASWAITPGATSYQLQRSADGVNFSNLTTPVVTGYLDTSVQLGTQYYYQVAAINTGGTSSYTAPAAVIPATTGELPLAAIRLGAQQRADKVNSSFVTLPEWNFFINQAMYELYDMLLKTDVTLFFAPRCRFNTVGNQWIYPLPDGKTVMQDINGNNFTPAPFYKLLGVDLSINASANAFVTVSKFTIQDRNKYIYPSNASAIYGVFNLQYRLFGNNVEFIPTPSANQVIQLLYVPRLPQLLQDTDLSTIGYSGWLQYVIVRAAKYALDKEESDTSSVDQEIGFLTQRITATASDRDEGRPERISDVRGYGAWDGNGDGSQGPLAGW